MQMQPQLEHTRTRFYNVQPGFAVAPDLVTASKVQRPDRQALELSGSADICETKSGKKREKDSDTTEKAVAGHMSASQLMSIYKCLGPAAAGVGYGLIFKGGSVLFAVMMSLLASSLSVVAVNKIHKEDGAFSQGIVNLSGKVMGRQPGRSPANKEWSMVPVWGVVCGFAGLLEAMLNHAYSKKFPSPSVTSLIQPESAHKKGLVGTFHRVRSTSLGYMMASKSWLKDTLPETKYLPRMMSQTPKWLIEKMENNVRGNVGVAYFFGALIPGISAIIQSGGIIKIQEKWEAKKAAKNKHKIHTGKAHHGQSEANKVASPQPDPTAGKKSGNVQASDKLQPSGKVPPTDDAVKKTEASTQKAETKLDKQSLSVSKEKITSSQSKPQEKKTPDSIAKTTKPDHKTGQKTEAQKVDPPAQVEPAQKVEQTEPDPPQPSSPGIFAAQPSVVSSPRHKSLHAQQVDPAKQAQVNSPIPRHWNYAIPQQQVPYQPISPLFFNSP